MDKELKIKISIASNTRELTLASSGFDALEKTADKAAVGVTTFNNKTKDTIDVLAHSAQALLGWKEILSATIGKIGEYFKGGVTLNGQMEQLQMGLTSLNAATSANVDNFGNAISYQQKFKIALSESAQTMQMLLSINAATPHSLEETIQIYKAMYVGMRNVGATSADMIDITKKISIAAGSAGVEFGALLSAMDGLATGTVEVSSDMGRFLRAIGLSNEALKESSNVVELLKQKLEDFKAIDTFATKVSNLANSFDALQREMSETLFNSVSDNINGLSTAFDKMARNMNYYKVQWADVNELTAQNDLLMKHRLILREIAEVKNDKFMWDSAQRIRLEELNKELKITTLRLHDIAMESGNITVVAFDDSAILKDVQDVLDPYEVKIDAINKRWLGHFELMFKNGKDVSGVIAAWTKELEPFDEVSSQASTKKNKNKLRTDKERKDAINAIEAYSFSVWKEGEDKKAKERAKSFVQIVEQTNARTAILQNAEMEVDPGGVAMDEALEKWRLMEEAVQGVWDADKMEKFYAAMNKDLAQVGKSQNYWSDKQRDTLSTISGTAGAFGQLAGTAAQFYEQGSNGQKAFLIIQQMLAAVTGVTAILNQGGGDPLSAPVRMAAMAAVVGSTLASIGMTLSTKGSGGGISQTQKNQNTIDATYAPVTDRLDAQIALLKSINNKTGTASQVTMNKAQVEYEKDLASFVNESAYGLHSEVKANWSTEGLRNETIDEVNKYLGFKIGEIQQKYTEGVGDLKIDKKAISNPDNFIKLLEAYNSGFMESMTSDWYVLFDKGWQKTSMSAGVFARANLDAMTAEYQTLVSKFASAIFSSRDELIDTKEALEDIYDSVTGTEKFKSERLKDAEKLVDKLRGSKSFTDYLLDEADNISKLDNILNKVADNEKTYEDILLSQDPAQLKEQNRILSEIQAKTNLVFDDGGRSVINYMESIKLLGEAMSEVTAETKDLQSQVFDLIASENEKRAAALLTLDASNRIYKEFIWAVEDAQKAIEDETNAKREALTEQQGDLNDYLSGITSDISTLDGAFTAISGVIQKLKGETLGTSYNLQRFKELMSETISLSQNKDYEAYNKTLQDTINASQVLFDANNFQSANDQKFAQLIALNQFESLEDVTLDQIDYLEKIEVNTRATAEEIAKSLNALGESVGSSMQSVVNSVVANNPQYKGVVDSSNASQLTGSSYMDTVSGAYRALFGRTIQDEGVDYWSGRTDLEDASQKDIYTAIATGASTAADVYKAVEWLALNTNGTYGQELAAKSADNGIISQSAFLDMAYNYGLGRTPDAEGKDYWLSLGLSSAELLNRFPRGAEVAGQTYMPFADGGLVKGGAGGVLGLIGEKSYDELVVPLKNPNDPLNQKELINELRELRKDVQTLTAITETQAKIIRDIDKREDRIYRETA